MVYLKAHTYLNKKKQTNLFLPKKQQEKEATKHSDVIKVIAIFTTYKETFIQ